MKVILHEAKFNTLFGAVYSLLTLSGYSHGSVIDNQGQQWDTTLTRGAFSPVALPSSDPDREIIVIDMPDLNADVFIRCNEGRRYDALGLFLWPWRREDPAAWYCFEAVGKCLQAAGLDIKREESVSAKTLLNALLKRGYTATITRGRYYLDDYRDG